MKYFFLLVFILGCSDNNSSYFPLEKIKSWSYKVVIKPDVEKKTIYKKINVSLGKKYIEINGKNELLYPLLREDGSIFYYETDKNGIYRNGYTFTKDKNINLDNKRRIVLPHSQKMGEQWEVESKTYLILKRYPYFDYRATTNFKINYKIISKTEIINTPMGKFKNCLLIKGVGKTRFIGDSEIGAIEIKITSEEWYAKNIGLIKTVRTEKTDSDLFGTTKMTQTLENFNYK